MTHPTKDALERFKKNRKGLAFVKSGRCATCGIDEDHGLGVRHDILFTHSYDNGVWVMEEEAFLAAELAAAYRKGLNEGLADGHEDGLRTARERVKAAYGRGREDERRGAADILRSIIQGMRDRERQALSERLPGIDNEVYDGMVSGYTKGWNAALRACREAIEKTND